MHSCSPPRFYRNLAYRREEDGTNEADTGGTEVEEKRETVIKWQ